MIDETHDPTIVSWVESANDPASDFPPQNLPFGIFRRAANEAGRIGVAIGDQVLDLQAALQFGSLGEDPRVAFAAAASTLNDLMSLGPQTTTALRRSLCDLLRSDSAAGERAAKEAAALLTLQRDVYMQLPARVGDYTDFYASISHATNVGSMFRPDNPLLPNYKWVPIGYHGRASSIVVSGTPVQRPWGQSKGEQESVPTFTPSRRLDYEVEVGIL